MPTDGSSVHQVSECVAKGDVAVVEANGDRSSSLLSPRRLCLRLIMHGRMDHGFGCVCWAID